jgi:hypothetical protein
MRLTIPALALVLGLPALAQAGDGQWRLDIDGHNTYLYGEPQLGGGLRIGWRVVVRFAISGGEFSVGHGTAEMDGEPVPLSYPPGWVACRDVEGSYLDSNLKLHRTPRIRFSRFPVAGAVEGDAVSLQPGYGAPGNYLAVTYECTLQDERGDQWFALAERGKQVMGKRQDAERRSQGDRQHVRVREVVGVPPETEVTLPLVDGWQFSSGSPDAAIWVRYRLVHEG